MVQIVNAGKLKHYHRNKVRFRCVNVNTLHKGYNKYNNNSYYYYYYYYITVSWLWRFLIAVIAVAQAHS